MGKYFAGFMQRRAVVVTPLAVLFVRCAEFQSDAFAGAADELDILLHPVLGLECSCLLPACVTSTLPG